MNIRVVDGIRVRAPEPCLPRLSILRQRAESEGPMGCVMINLPVEERYEQRKINQMIAQSRRGKGRMTRVALVDGNRVWPSVTDLAKELRTNPTYIHMRIKKGKPIDGRYYEKVN